MHRLTGEPLLCVTPSAVDDPRVLVEHVENP
jgi:hypothetical protein